MFHKEIEVILEIETIELHECPHHRSIGMP